MKKLFVAIAFTLCALITLSVSALAAGTSSATNAKTGTSSATNAKTETYLVINDGVNVRSGPGATFSKLGTLTKGTKETGIIKEGWLEFTYNGKSAYCSAKYLKSDADTTKASAPKSAGKTVTYIVSSKELNIRSGPGTTYSSLGKLTKGTKETGVLENGWLKFTYNNVTAYCNLKYMSEASATSKK